MIQQGATLLIIASQIGHDDIVQLLLDRGAGVDRPREVCVCEICNLYLRLVRLKLDQLNPVFNPD